MDPRLPHGTRSRGPMRGTRFSSDFEARGKELSLEEFRGKSLYCSCKTIDGEERCHAQVLIRLYKTLVDDINDVQ